MSECKHMNFYANVSVARITENEGDIDAKAFVAEITVHCIDCKTRMLFTGVEGGFNFTYPTVNVEGTKLHAPMIPENKIPKIRKGVLVN